tara:strand:- start:231 stop:1154 length:924 start_codon:yes stop_codon:yes gene_type:complete
MKLQRFKEFILEALDRTEHYETRVDERIYNLRTVKLATRVESYIHTLGLDAVDIKKSIIAKISNEFKIINTRLEKTVFSPGHKVVPMLETFIKTDTGTYPVNMTVYSNTYDSKGVKTGEKSYSGEILYGYISNQALTTVKVWPHGTELNDIEKNAKDHLSRESRRDDVTVFEIDESTIYKIFEIDATGELNQVDFGLKNRGYIANANQQYILSPGRKLKVWIPFKQAFVEVKIIEILNEETFKDDRFIKLSILSADNTKLVKTLKPGDTVELPIGANNTWVTTKISDSLYIYDKRLEYPISLNITII